MGFLRGCMCKYRERFSRSLKKDDGMSQSFLDYSWLRLYLILELLGSFITLTCFLAGCVLGATVHQYPRRSICKSGTSMKIECHSVGVQATTVVWYHQSPQRTFELMAISTVSSAVKYEQNFTQDKFPISHPNLTFSSLTVLNAYPQDGGFYLCGARDTALGRNMTPQQEPESLPFPAHRYCRSC